MLERMIGRRNMGGEEEEVRHPKRCDWQGIKNYQHALAPVCANVSFHHRCCRRRPINQNNAVELIH